MSSTTWEGPRPWEQPFWKPSKGKASILFYLVAVHVLAFAGLILFPLPGWKILGWALLLACLGGLGTTICYHRSLSHRTVKLNTVVEHILIFWAMFNGSGAPDSWVAYHRHHHANSDTPEDISSPSHGGFWWAHLRWLYQAQQPDVERWCAELGRGGYRFWSRAEIPVILFSIFCGLPFGWAAFFWVGAIRLVYSLHLQCAVNSVAHMGHAGDGDSSQNMWWLGPLQATAWGENWHRNHHAYPGSARFATHWWQPDFGWYVINLLEAVGLATNVKRPVGRSQA